MKTEKKMNIILSTRNPSKLLQIQEIFDDSNIQVLTLDDVNIQGEAVEDGTLLEENAYKKAWFAYENAGRNVWTMADDTGLFITALNGEPGIYAARWAGENASLAETMNFCLQKLQSAQDRSAVFRTAVVVISPDGESHVFFGEIQGHMLTAPRVPPQPKMPYSALFVPDGQDLAWAEMTTQQENTISHRGIVFRKVKSFLENL
jgi:XTP/dITP diphosphohydrolase